MKNFTTRMGFEPTRAEHNGLAVHRLNHSATSSSYTSVQHSLSRNLNEVAGNNSRQIRNNALTAIPPRQLTLHLSVRFQEISTR